MSYRATDQSSTLTPEQRAAEAQDILVTMGLADRIEDMNENERDFVERLMSQHEILGRIETVSVKQLFWLRDLKEKYL